MDYLPAAGAALILLAGLLGLRAQPREPGWSLIRRLWAGRLPKTQARAAFRRLRFGRDLAILLGVSFLMGWITANPLIAGLGGAMALVFLASYAIERRKG